MSKFIYAFIAFAISNSAYAFNNTLSIEDKCGYTKGGAYQYVNNGDPSNAYKVTIREHYKVGGNSGHTDKVVRVSAGSREALGCTISDSIPITKWTREVVGETITK